MEKIIEEKTEDLEVEECLKTQEEVASEKEKESEVLFLTAQEKDEIAEKDYKLVFSVVKSFSSTGISMDELESIAQVGFVKALNAFDKNRGIKFTTYAVNCMQNEILYFLRKENKHIYNNISFSKVIAVDKQGKDLTIEDILSEDGQQTNPLESGVILSEDVRILNECIQDLSSREQYIITKRFGLGGCAILTQRQIADEIGMSQANVSKLEKTVAKRLKKALVMRHVSMGS